MAKSRRSLSKSNAIIICLIWSAVKQFERESCLAMAIFESEKDLSSMDSSASLKSLLDIVQGGTEGVGAGMYWV